MGNSIKQKIKALAVRLEIEGEDKLPEVIGSGVVWNPNEEENQYMYIFTAAHVVYNFLEEDVKFYASYYDINGKKDRQIIDKDNIKYHKDYIKDDENTGRNLNDVAVIRVKNINCKKSNFKIVRLCEIDDEVELIFSGFMKKLESLEFEINRNEYTCKFDSIIKEKEAFKYKLDKENALDEAMKNEDLIGVSGAGIFLNNQKDLHLIGIHTHGVGNDVTMNMLIGMSADLILDILKENEWDTIDIETYEKNNYNNYFNELRDKNKKILEYIDFIDRQIQNVENGEKIETDSLLYDKNNYIILSEPGGGKTSIIKNLCYYVSNNNLNKIPIILDLKYYNKTNFKDIKERIFNILFQYNKNLTKDEVNNLINNGELIIFLDGLDEVDQNSYEKCKSEIIDLINYNGKSKYILTCRSNRYNREFEHLLKELELKELSFGEIRNYLCKVSKNIYKEKLDEKVLNIIKNPLLLSIFRDIIKRNISYKPNNRVDLYNEFIENLIYKWNKKEGKSVISSSMKIKLKKIFNQIAKITFEMNDFSEEILYDLVYELYGDESKVDEFFDYILNIGILESANDVIWFKHKTYKEYFMAKYIMKTNGNDRNDLIKSIINNNDYSEVIIFMSGMFNNWEEQNKFLDMVLDSNFKLYIECVNGKNDLDKDFNYMSHEEVSEIYLNMINEIYTKIIDRYFYQIKDKLLLGRYYNKSDLDFKNMRFNILKSLKKQLLDMIKYKEIYSIQLICEEINKHKKEVGIKDNEKIIEFANEQLKKYPDMRGYIYKRVDILELANIINYLNESNINIEENILPDGDIIIDKNRGGYFIWEPYSKERLTDRIEKFFEFYKKSIIYIVETYFDGIKDYLPCYRNLPYTYTVEYYFTQGYLNGKSSLDSLDPGGVRYFYESSQDNSYKPNLIEYRDENFRDNYINKLENKSSKYRKILIGGFTISTISMDELLHDDCLQKYVYKEIEREIKYLFEGIK